MVKTEQRSAVVHHVTNRPTSTLATPAPDRTEHARADNTAASLMVPDTRG